MPRSAEALAFYRELCANERAIKKEIARNAPDGKAVESERAAIRLRIRQERAGPVLERFRLWLEAQKQDSLLKSTFGIAIGHVQNNWEALSRYVTSGYLAIDNNVAQQHMKTIATQELAVCRERDRRQGDGGVVQRGAKLSEQARNYPSFKFSRSSGSGTNRHRSLLW
jgi:Transposase IS66 family